ncbi:MAG: hypothetical protein ACI8UO_001357 [Verrucomicrobiales bacterium]|jgi:hypothetical protein
MAVFSIETAKPLMSFFLRVPQTHSSFRNPDSSSCWNVTRVFLAAFAAFAQVATAETTTTSENPAHAAELSNFQNPAAMMGVESCRDCHDSHVEAWENTKHATSFSNLHERELAQSIASLLEVQPLEIRQEASCSRCHFTEEKIHGVIQIEQAVSCESCHGAGESWIDVHNNGSLSRQFRVLQSSKAGMAHPDNVHDMGKRCYDCHVIDSEALVNIAGHPATSEGFEFYSWSQGEMKHNFMYEKEGRKTKRNGKNPVEIPQSRARKLFLAGKLLHLSATLNAIAKSQDPPTDVEGNYVKLPDGKYTFAVQHALKARELAEEIRKLQKIVPNKCYAKVIGIMESLQLETGNTEAIQEAAGMVDDVAEHFCLDATGAEYPALDQILAKLEMR